MNIQTKQPSAYAPTQADPLRLASATIQAVDRIGETTSEEIERTANEITHGAAQIAEKLQELASAIREHSKIANEHVSRFCEKPRQCSTAFAIYSGSWTGTKANHLGPRLRMKYCKYQYFFRTGRPFLTNPV